MLLPIATARAQHLLETLAPYCERIAIAGSIRRKKEEVKDIELVCIPKLGGGLFGGQFNTSFTATVLTWGRILKGSPGDGKYIMIELPDGLRVDLFTTTGGNWGWIYLLRTGSADHNIRMVQRLKANGYMLHAGHIWWKGVAIPIPTEEEAFQRAGLKWKQPEERA